ncbi:hypothetical protein IF1G_01713 [Cordyceps javanica]|uniref:Uncharacterized protein n=1 Tax=Cordyceps javanica TaxID=43265 RepID=A0A545VCP5_9HYPO|nr:hypothetical protein IF1G_01713 [Cordyceps javanica]
MANHFAAVAQGIIAQMRISGGSIGVAISFILLQTRVIRELQGEFSQTQLREFYQSPLSVTSFTAAQLIFLRRVYISAFTDIMQVSIGVSGACFLASLFVWQKRPANIQQKLEGMEAYFGVR